MPASEHSYDLSMDVSRVDCRLRELHIGIVPGLSFPACKLVVEQKMGGSGPIEKL